MSLSRKFFLVKVIYKIKQVKRLDVRSSLAVELQSSLCKIFQSTVIDVDKEMNRAHDRSMIRTLAV